MRLDWIKVMRKTSRQMIEETPLAVIRGYLRDSREKDAQQSRYWGTQDLS
jgi:hypothetical protein